MKTEVQKIASLLRRSFEKNSWHGPSLKESLEGLTPEQLTHHFPGTHSIIELVPHITAWRIFVVKRLTGDTTYEVTDQLNFPKEIEWQKVIYDLEESQRNLLVAMEHFPEERLHEIVPHASFRYSYYTLLHGIIHHDLYHTGQIMLIKKSLPSQTV